MPSATDTSTHLSQLPEALQALARCGVMRHYRKGSFIITEGESGDSLFVLLRGKVQVCSVDEKGREVVYCTQGPGTYFGEMSLDGGARSASVISLEPTTCALVLGPALAQFIEAHPEFALEVLKKVISCARDATQRIRDMALLNVYGRMRRLLESMAVSQPDGSRKIGERLTHAGIANRLGCSREMISKLMADLEQGAHLSYRRGIIVLYGTLPARW